MRLLSIIALGLLGCGGGHDASDAAAAGDMAASGDLATTSAQPCGASVPAAEPTLTGGAPFAHEDVTVGGIFVDRYVWLDSQGRVRSVALKKECSGNTGHGGYAVQMTYQLADGTTRTLVTDDSEDGGFGYFVSHEAYRTFDDGTTGTIAALHGEDDSALGKGFAVVGTASVGTMAATHTFAQHYYRWGTKSAFAYDDGTGNIPAPADLAQHVRYDLPVTITWSFATGTDHPMIRTKVDQSAIPGPDLVFFDVRGPYGLLPFDEGKDTAVQGLFWGDRFYDLTSSRVPLTWASGADWSAPNPDARHHALVAGDYEMGLYEPRAIASTALADGYSDSRGKPAAMVSCADSAMLALPCPGEWPYQSINYSLDESTPDQPTTGLKIAWGSAAFYGSSLTTISAGDGLSEPFDGRPSGGLTYDVCVVVDRPKIAQPADGAATMQSTTRAAAQSAANRAPGGLCAVLD